MTKLVRKRNVVSVRLGDRAFAELSNARPIMMAWYRSLVSDARAATSQLAANRSHNWLFAAHTGSQYLLALGLPAARLAGVLDNNQAKIGSRMYGSTLWVHAPSVIAGLRAPRVLLRQGVYNAELRTQLLAINPSCVIITGGAEPLASASDDVATSSAATTKYHRSTPLLAPRTVKGRRGGGRASGRLEVGEASSNFSAYYWTAAGCPQETVRAGAARVAKRPAPKARCEHASNVAAIRCCGGSHHSGGKCVSLCAIAVKKFSSGLAATHGEAVSACAAHGMRLCSLEELASQICCRTGCLMDGRRVWTNGACSARECHEGTPGTIVDALDGTEDTGGGDDAPLHCQRTERAREAGPNWCSALDSATAEALQGTAVVACVNIKDLGIGSELYGLYGALTLLRAWHSEHPETLVALQEPQLMDYDGGGGDGDNLRLTDLLNVSLLRDALPPTVRWLPPNIQPCSLLDNEISFTSNGLAVSPLLTSNGLAVRSSLGRKGLAGVSGLGLGTTIPEMWRHVRTWRQTSNCPARIFIGGNNYGPSACAITAQTSAARLVANAMSFRVPSSLEAISERVRPHARHCFFLFTYPSLLTSPLEVTDFDQTLFVQTRQRWLLRRLLWLLIPWLCPDRHGGLIPATRASFSTGFHSVPAGITRRTSPYMHATAHTLLTRPLEGTTTVRAIWAHPSRQHTPLHRAALVQRFLPARRLVRWCTTRGPACSRASRLTARPCSCLTRCPWQLRSCRWPTPRH